MDGKRAIPQLWEGMLSLYSAPGVADACLEVQDACEADVLLLLTAALLAGEGILLTPELAGYLSSETAEWRREVVVPLRQLRQRWRGRHSMATLRERIKALELEAERRQVDMLQALLESATLRLQADAGLDLLRANCEALAPGLQHSAACKDALASFRRCVAARRAAETTG